MNNDTDCEWCSYYGVSCDGKTKFEPKETKSRKIRCENHRRDLTDREIEAILEQK